jgi:hypothetical protein
LFFPELPLRSFFLFFAFLFLPRCLLFLLPLLFLFGFAQRFLLDARLLSFFEFLPLFLFNLWRE